MQLAIAGNTRNPTLYALRAKGYGVSLSYQRDGNGDLSSWYTATTQGRRFVASSPEELLGLVAMWEVRGDDWSPGSDEERAWCDALFEAARVYDDDGRDVTEDEDG
jgi:hypothetical protein